MAWTDGRDSAGQRHLKFQQSFPELSKCKENHISVKNKKYNDQNLFIQILWPGNHEDKTEKSHV